MAKKSFKEGLNSLLQQTDKEQVANTPKKVENVKVKSTKKKVSKKKSVSAKPVKKQTKALKTTTKQAVVKTETPVTKKESPAANTKDSKNNTDNFSVIEIDSTLNIDIVEELKKKLETDSKGLKNIKISCPNNDFIDLSVIQVLYSFKSEMEKANKTVSFDININDEMKALLENAGMFDKALFN